MVNKKHIRTGWMTWDEIQPFREQLIDLELELMTVYHYPDWDIPRTYPEQKVQELEKHLQDGNTFFWGAVCGEILAGYYWAYIVPFIDRKRWYLRSVMFRKEYQGIGLGSIAIEEGLIKARAAGCDEAVTEYISSNQSAAKVYEKAGYRMARIEVVKRLGKRDG